MAKEYYDVSFKTYFNDRIKRVSFQGIETYPLYIRVTYNRNTTFFKSYYFDLFSQPKYDFLKTTIDQINKLEAQVIDYIINLHSHDFNLSVLSWEYKRRSIDILDTLDKPFKAWLMKYFIEKELPGMALLMEHAMHEVPAIRIWEDLKKILTPNDFRHLERKTTYFCPPYILLASYAQHIYPKGPFCLPLYVWLRDFQTYEYKSFFNSLSPWLQPDDFIGQLYHQFNLETFDRFN